MPSKNTTQKLQPGSYYHIYNRVNNSEKIFYQERNYRYFLRKFDYYLTNYLDLFAFVLMPNHFHFLVRTRRLQGFKTLDAFYNKQ